ncbi:outer membrane lipoprotein LolB [Hahella sp. CCB-MM4]|uniref:lipoprotein insertase outer membrane protein LolB n=1 Tax=Hahella sp. (strain CCB-MM4) TaxID=1926491 RepID=UPI000B9A406D|nr:lipoprotein insertase outer membrane protein LolB [Hahella sp. CCB-MM4]OZG70679.1 outer membrane lipoprotein LolB [Hahella sp. CCB-MM4]
MFANNLASQTKGNPLVFLALIVFSFWLTGCETTPKRQTSSQTPADWQERRQQLTDFNHWNLQGKLAVRQGDRSDSLVINQWTQIESQFNIHVSSALLGLGATQIEGNPNYIGLLQPDEAPLYSDSPEQLLQETLGWSLPLQSLAYWIKGIPSPEHPAEMQFDSQGQPYILSQSDWQIEFDRFLPFGALLLPHKITLTKGDIRLKVVVTQWTAI